MAAPCDGIGRSFARHSSIRSRSSGFIRTAISSVILDVRFGMGASVCSGAAYACVNTIILYNIVNLFRPRGDTMPDIELAAALLEALTPADVQALPPTTRRRFAAVCRRCAELAEPKPEKPKAGVLAALYDGARHE